ncbi:hypothetical protein Cflav_PD2608 [Pedosphaera parvula Ellin514]|uniref:Uncharacterized protein n=1 Tax=Pedosphaera parvula (strain Ellin514) TaxID=320771 RepID=B9XKE9_PEDPL|nr:hypothetical protein Cflav_PD2608 [Pedosphaera parvula Ellin514]
MPKELHKYYYASVQLGVKSNFSQGYSAIYIAFLRALT